MLKLVGACALLGFTVLAGRDQSQHTGASHHEAAPAGVPSVGGGRDLTDLLGADGSGRITPQEFAGQADAADGDLRLDQNDADRDDVLTGNEFSGTGARSSTGGPSRATGDEDLDDSNIVPITLAWLRDGGASAWRFNGTRPADAVTRTLEVLFSGLDLDWSNPQIPQNTIRQLDVAVQAAGTALRQFRTLKSVPWERMLRPWVRGVVCSPLVGRAANDGVVAVVRLPVLQFLVELYLLSRSAVVRSVLLQFCDEVAFPGVPTGALASGTAELGLVPSVMQLAMGFAWLDVTLLSHLSRAGHPTPALLLPQLEWCTDGSKLQAGSAKACIAQFSREGTLSPLGLSQLHLLVLGSARAQDLSKMLYVVLDVMRMRGVDCFEALELLGEHPLIRSVQGHRMLVDVLFPNLLMSSPTFRRLRAEWEEDIASADYVSIVAVRCIVEELSTAVFRQLASGGDNVTRVDIDVSGVPGDQISEYRAYWRLEKAIPARHSGVPRPRLDLRELSVRLFSTGRNPLHELALAGFGHLAEEVLGVALERMAEQEAAPGYKPPPHLDLATLPGRVAEASEQAVRRVEALYAAEDESATAASSSNGAALRALALQAAADEAVADVFRKDAGMRARSYRAALQAALLSGDWRLRRTPLHVAALRHGGASLVFSALCDAAVRAGLHLDALLDVPDAANVTARAYARAHFEPLTEGAVRAAAPATHAAVATADKVDGSPPRSTLVARRHGRGGGGRAVTEAAAAAAWDSAGPTGGWEPNRREDLELHPPGLCEVTEFVGLPTAAELAVVFNRNHPVVFRGALRALGVNRSAWARRALVARYGRADAALRDIPYRMSRSSVLDQGSAEVTTSLADYVKSLPEAAAAAARAAAAPRTGQSNDHNGGAGAGAATDADVPLYLFSSGFADRNPGLYEDVREVVELVDAVPGIAGLQQGQFFLGAAGSGAPMHLHSLAINALLYGRKRWAVVPPADAHYSVKPAARFFREDLPALRHPTATTHARFQRPRGTRADSVHDEPGARSLAEFTQEAGDLVFLPDSWGHATINVETSVGMAFEIENYNEGAHAVTPELLRRVQADHPGAKFGFAFPAD